MKNNYRSNLIARILSIVVGALGIVVMKPVFAAASAAGLETSWRMYALIGLGGLCFIAGLISDD